MIQVRALNGACRADMRQEGRRESLRMFMSELSRNLRVDRELARSSGSPVEKATSRIFTLFALQCGPQRTCYSLGKLFPKKVVRTPVVTMARAFRWRIRYIRAKQPISVF